MKREEALQAFLARWANQAEALFRECWPEPVFPQPDSPHPQWDGFETAFAALPADKQCELARFTYEFALAAIAAVPRDGRAEAINRDAIGAAKQLEAAKALRSGIHGDSLGPQCYVEGSKLYRALVERACLSEADARAEALKLASTSPRLSEAGRVFVERLVKEAPAEVQHSAEAISAWLLSEWGIRYSARSVRNIR